MKNEFEARLNDCLEALREGRWDVAECLRRYPQDAERLRPLLLAAQDAAHAYNVAPRGDFARDARERFLIASGQRLQEAFENDPEPSFFAAARVRFLMAAHRMRTADAATSAPRRVVPFVERHFRTFASAAAAIVIFLSFSTYTVASANSALPGDWQYGVKLQTERVRLALAFSDSAKRDVRLDLAEERARELEQLTKDGQTIDAGVLGRLVEQTTPLVDDVDHGWDTQDVARLQAIAAREKRVLDQAKSQVEPEAQDKLAQAVDVSNKGLVVASQIIVQRPSAPPEVVTPSKLLEPPTASATPSPSETPGTPGAPAETTTPPPPTATEPPGDTLSIGPTPASGPGGISWRRLAVGRMTTLIPDETNGWVIVGLGGVSGPVPAPTLVKLSNANGTSLITINPRNGDMWWFIYHGDRFGEIDMRVQQPDGSVLVVEPEYLTSVYGADAAIPLYVLESIKLEPTAIPTPDLGPPDKLTPVPQAP